jgi:hypothetical protein
MIPAGEVPHIDTFDKKSFEGDHTHIFGNMPKLGKWNNSISSIVPDLVALAMLAR